MGISLSGLNSTSTGNLNLIAAAGSQVKVNENSQNIDFVAESDDIVNFFFIDASTSQIGIGSAPANANGLVTLDHRNFNRAAANSVAAVLGYAGGTYNTTNASSTIAQGANISFPGNTLTNNNSTLTYTKFASLWISGGPTAGSNVAITNPYALQIDTGAVYFGDRTFSVGGVNYEWPNSLSAGTYLKVDGSGNLSWAAATATATGSGTTGKMVKWTDGAAGAIGDSVISEVSGNIGINDTTPGVNFGGGTADYSGAVEIAPSSNRSALLLSGTVDSQVVFGDSGQSSGTRKAALGFYQGKLSMYHVADGNIGRSGDGGIHLQQNGNVGIGIAAPDDLLHVYAGDSGATAGGYAQMVLEDNADLEFSIMTPDANRGQINFKSATAASHGFIRYFHNSDSPADTMDFGTANNESMRLSGGATPTLRFAGATIISTASNNLTISAATGADVLIGDNVTLLAVDGGTNAVIIGTTSINQTGTINTTSGNLTLTSTQANINFTPSGDMNLTAGNFKIGGSTAGSGKIRLENNAFIGWLNAAGNSNITFGLNSSDKFAFSTDIDLVGTGTKTIKVESTNDNYGILILDGDRSSADASVGQLQFKWNNNRVAEINGLSGPDTTNKDDGQLRFRTAAPGGGLATAMLIDENQKVGIGITAPIVPFHVYHATINGVARFESGDGTASIQVMDNASLSSYPPSISATGHVLSIFGGTSTAHASPLVIDASGNVGIGGSGNAIDHELHIEDSSSNSTPTIKIENDAIGYRFQINGSDADKFQLLDTTGFDTFLQFNPSTKDVGIGVANKDVGIGTATPGATLDIVSNGASGAALRVYNSDATNPYGMLVDNTAADANDLYYIADFRASGSSKLIVLNNGKVGIGISVPATKLHVNGAWASTANVAYFFNSDMADGNDTSIWIGKAKTTDQSMGIGFHYDTTAADSYAWLGVRHGDDPAAGTTVVVKAGGKVGIGLVDPTVPLEVSGKTNHLGIIRMVQRVSGAGAYGLDMGLDANTGDPVFSRIVNNTVTEAFRIQRASGYIGIATGDTISAPLHVYHASTNTMGIFQSGDATAIIKLRDSASDATYPPQLQTDGNIIKLQGGTSAGHAAGYVAVAANGNVGIGTTSPDQNLHVSDGNAYLFLEATESSNGDTNRGSEISFIGTDGARAAMAGIRGAHAGTGTDHKGMLRFYTTEENGNGSLIASNNGTERMRIKANGDLDFNLNNANYRVTLRASASTLFYGGLVINESGGSTSEHALRVESNNNTSMLRVDASTDRVGIGVYAPQATLDINGSLRITSGSPADGKVWTATNSSGDGAWETPLTVGTAAMVMAVIFG